MIFNFCQIMGGFNFSDPWYRGQKISLKFFGEKSQFLYIKLHLKQLGIKYIPNFKKNGGISSPLPPIVDLIRIGPDSMKLPNAVIFHIISLNETAHNYIFYLKLHAKI